MYFLFSVTSGKHTGVYNRKLVFYAQRLHVEFMKIYQHGKKVVMWFCRPLGCGIAAWAVEREGAPLHSVLLHFGMLDCINPSLPWGPELVGSTNALLIYYSTDLKSQHTFEHFT